MIETTAEKFKEVSKEMPFSVAYLYAEQCKHCQSFTPLLEDLQVKYPALYMRKMDAFKNPSLAEEVKMDAIPFLAIFNYGTYVGGGAGASIEGIKALIEYLLAQPVDKNGMYEEAQLV